MNTKWKCIGMTFQDRHQGINGERSTYQEEVQQHELQKHQQLPEQKGHMQQVRNYEQDGERSPAKKSMNAK